MDYWNVCSGDVIWEITMNDVDWLLDGLRLLQYRLPRYEQYRSVHEYLLQTYHRDLERIKETPEYETFNKWIMEYEKKYYCVL